MRRYPTLLTCLILASIFASLQGCGAINVAERIINERDLPENRMSGTQRDGSKDQAELWKPTMPGTGFHRKRVAGKSAPSELVADDGTRCTVSADRFERTQPGARVLCRWAHPQTSPAKHNTRRH